jgi:hypothetical protein
MKRLYLSTLLELILFQLIAGQVEAGTGSTFLALEIAQHAFQP